MVKWEMTHVELFKVAPLMLEGWEPFAVTEGALGVAIWLKRRAVITRQATKKEEEDLTLRAFNDYR